MYVGSSYTWNTKGKVTITANYGGKDYKNTSPASNPASGVMSRYGSITGVRGNGNGSTVFTENNTMPVFDPEFDI